MSILTNIYPQALTLLDYLLKTGSERVAQQCRENAFTIQVLRCKNQNLLDENLSNSYTSGTNMVDSLLPI